MKPILMTERYWANTQLSVVRHTGRIRLDGTMYVIVNKEGKDIFQCSIEADKEGRDKAIEPGEPADLIDERFIKYYKKLGRERFIQILEDNKTKGDKDMKIIMRDIMRNDGQNID